MGWPAAGPEPGQSLAASKQLWHRSVAHPALVSRPQPSIPELTGKASGAGNCCELQRGGKGRAILPLLLTAALLEGSSQLTSWYCCWPGASKLLAFFGWGI